MRSAEFAAAFNIFCICFSKVLKKRCIFLLLVVHEVDKWMVTSIGRNSQKTFNSPRKAKWGVRRHRDLAIDYSEGLENIIPSESTRILCLCNSIPISSNQLEISAIVHPTQSPSSSVHALAVDSFSPIIFDYLVAPNNKFWEEDIVDKHHDGQEGYVMMTMQLFH